jgi:signal transduction histidine kinase
MKSIVERARRLEAIADGFVPPGLFDRSPEEARRARFGVVLAWVGVLFFLLGVVVQGPMNSRAVLVLNLLSALLCFAAPFVIRGTGRTLLVCHVVLGLGYCRYVSIALLLRGAGLSGATVLLAQLPLIATFLTGVRAGAVWAILSIATEVGIGLLGRTGIIVDRLPPADRLFNDHFILVVSTTVLYSIAALYERRKEAAKRQLQALEESRRAAELERVQAVAKVQLAEAERLASLGRIAAATAHEINNPLTSVLTNLSLVAEALPEGVDTETVEAVHDALRGAERIGRIVADMRLSSGPLDGALSPVSLADAIGTALKMAQPHTGTRARIRVQLDPSLPLVVASAPGLSRVLLNLVVNAA